MRIRAVDANNDWKFGKGKQSYLFDENAIAQNIKSRLLSFLNDCWFDMGAGIDWIRLLGSRGSYQELELRIRATILQSYGVTKVNNIALENNSSNRKATIQYSIDTIYSQSYESTLEV